MKAGVKRIGGPCWSGADFCCEEATFPGLVRFDEESWLLLHATKVSERALTIEAHTVGSFGDDGVAPSDDTELLFTSTVKWDACCDTLFAEGWVHTCDGLAQLADALRKTQDWARELLKVDGAGNEHMVDCWPDLPEEFSPGHWANPTRRPA